ncbi:N-acetyl-gamma-glutamyl-phosphate reductase [Pseudalgibacter alginicilyticus]|uniref:N-acetyl-gamma-glutamyl-phosphate reductase n=1 Tax=Pseudalgibacter alginicilyticus TaxID=1736674 RepID=A0A0P0CDN7_9FLAO|nr:translocation/assembly module TamB domain-containing protein [Pseudalgibacter alginicilyticus]ALJ04155.1 N-acetyl-gamma-glutamyl-phosphate reductase [Pseudalgibacter alginicilyticus]
MLFIILVLVLSIPAIQTSLGNYATKRINEDFKTNINIDRVSLQFNGDVEIKHIYIQDYKQDTLIDISELNTSILNFRNLYNGKLVFGDIDIINLTFNIKTYLGETGTNLDVFVKKFENDNPKKVKSDFLLSSSDVSIYNSVFRLINENSETSNQLEFTNLNINATNFLINGSNVSTRINTLGFNDSRGLVMKNMMTDFAYTINDMTFTNLDIKTPYSVLKGDLKFLYNREDLQYFTDKVLVEASFRDSNILLDELNIFYNEFGANQYANFNADFSGTLNDLQTTNLRLNSSANTKVYGDINFRNLFNKEAENFYMNGRFSHLSSTYRDLKSLLPNVLGEAIPSSFRRLGQFTIVGNSQITTSAIVADLEINTDLGLVDSKLKINKINDIDNAEYNGNIILKSFDIGAFLENPNVGETSLNLDINGSGFLIENIKTQVKGDIFDIGYNDYQYKNIKVAGNVMNKIFDGNLQANDKNLRLNFNGLIDYSEKINKYDFTANIDYANLNTLNFIKKDSISVLSSNVTMNMNASNMDDALGKVTFKNTAYKNQNDTYYFKEFNITSRFDTNKNRFIEINSPEIIEGNLNGKFVIKDFKKLFENSLGHIYTNYVPNKVAENQNIDFNFKIYNKIIEVFYPNIELGSNTFIKGRVKSDATAFRLTFKSPQIKLLDNFVKNIELQVVNDNPLFNTYVEVDSINTGFYNVSKFNLINVTLNDTLFMRSEFRGGKNNNDKYNLSVYHTINESNESVVGFKKSDVTIKGNTWFINEKLDNFNKITLDKSLSKFSIDKLQINHIDEEISLSGIVRDSTYKDIKLDFTDVDLEKILPDIENLSLKGNVNGKLDILQEHGVYLPNSTVVIDDLEVNEFELGSFKATIKGNENLTNYHINATIKDDEAKSFSAIGNINVLGKQSNIDVEVAFNQFNLSPLNPFLQDVLSNIRGEVTGKTKVVGDLKQPDINGNLSLENGGFTIPYLNVDYDLSKKSFVSLKNQAFIFNNVDLTDTKHNSKGKLNGTLGHVNFSKWRLDLNIDTPRLLVLDTKETEGSLYYGTGFIGGNASIKGPTEELVITVVGETKKGTVFKIPLSDTESFGDNSFIRFLTPEEKQARLSGGEFVIKEIKGLELDFDLDVTEDALLEIIIDKSTGHSLRGSGRGGILVEINTNGKFNMWGDFSVFDGVYNFAYGGIVQKQFRVQPGGTLAWEGDPLKAQIDMLAIYRTQANPSALLDSPINRSIPVELNITLTGDLEQPKPYFDFEFPNVNSTIKSELQYRLESGDDRQNQALYLLSTGAFSRGLNELNFTGTIAERLNGIINGIFTNDDSKLNIGVNYEVGENRPDYKTDDRFALTLQTQISDRVLINGKVGVPVGGADANETVVAGNVEIDFLLNEEGTLTAKIFNRENSIRNFGEAIGYTQGVGLSYDVDFNTFKELIQNLFSKSASPVSSETIFNEEKKFSSDDSLPEFLNFKSATNN